jgi:uncharacterized protein
MVRNKPLFIESNGGNFYLFSEDKEKIQLIHPLIYYFATGKIRLDNKFYKLTVKNITYDKETVEYYSKKYISLKTNDSLVENNNYKEIHRYRNKVSLSEIKSTLLNSTQLAIEVIQSCNLNCTYCIYGELYENKFRKHKLEFEKTKKILEFLFPIWKKEDVLNRSIRINYYGGEPLLEFGLIKDITEFIKENQSKIFKNITFTFGLTTNGTLLNKEKIEYFIANKFVIAVSIDGNRYNNSYRVTHTGRNIFDKLIENIEMIKNLNGEYFDRYVHFLSVLHNRNSLSEINSFLQSSFGKNFSKSGNLSRSGVSIKKIDEFNIIYNSTPNEKDFFYVKRVKFYYTDEVRKIKEKWNNNYHLDKKIIHSYTGTCIPFQKRIFITSDYYVFPCEKVSFKYNFKKIINVDNNIELDMKYILYKHNGYLSKISKFCKNCYYRSLCTKCIYSIDENSKGEFSCDHFFNKNDMIVYLSKIISYMENNN